MTTAAAPSVSTADKRLERILAAAEHQFISYGMRRTSMDDIARQADLAKGTLYLSFKSKDTLFSALAQRIVDRYHARATAAAAAQTERLEKIVCYLDEALGEPARLLASTPHAAEILHSKREIAGATIQRFEDQILADVALLCGHDDALAVMLIEAAHGCKATGSLAPPAYRTRLRRHVAVLLRGAALASSD